jgi:hypothetical protein
LKQIIEDSTLLKDYSKIEFAVSNIPNYDQEKSKLELLYRGSRDGWWFEDLRQRVYEKGPTITFVRSTQ